MAKAISIHIGLNSVDPRHYAGWSGDLVACEFDAKDMAAIAHAASMTSTLLLTKEATRKNVLAAVRAASKTLKSGDLLFVTYSGHGGQIDDVSGEEEDKQDETWCLYDGELVYDEVFLELSRIAAGVRVLVLSDSCHSGTVTRDIPMFAGAGPKPRAMPREVGIAVENANSALYRAIQKENRGAEKTKVNASILLVSGCMDNQTSMDGDSNGAFTGTLKKVWNGGKFNGDYRKLRDKIVSLMPSTQTPNYYFVGAVNAAYEGQKPFSIE
jgi:metacaspase-1